MGKVTSVSAKQDNQPRITCANCKRENKIDIRGWNQDITMVGEIRCKSCQRKMYVSLLILANTTVEALGQNVQMMVQSLGAKNTLLQGEETPQSILKH